MSHYYPFRGEPPLTAKQRNMRRRIAVKQATVLRHRNYSLNYGMRLRIYKQWPDLDNWQWPDGTFYGPKRDTGFKQWRPSLAMQRVYNTGLPF